MIESYDECEHVTITIYKIKGPRLSHAGHWKCLNTTYTFINNMATTISEPTLVLYKSAQCHYCNTLTAIWDTPKSKDEDSISTVLKKVYPKLRFFTLTAKDNSGKFDENTAPKDLSRYSKWFPMILLVPGKVWDEAMSKLGPKNDAKIIDGVQIMNGHFENNGPKYSQKYDIRKPADFGKWLEEALNNDEFKRVQSGLQPLPSQIAQSIQPILSNIVKPVNTANTHTGMINPESHQVGDFCSMRIIARPK